MPQSVRLAIAILLIAALPALAWYWTRGTAATRDDSMASARQLIVEGSPARAEQMLRRLLDLRRNDPELLVALAEACGTQGKRREARELTAQVPPGPGLGARARFLEGLTWWFDNDYAKAEESWKLARQLDPLVPEAVWRLLDLYFIERRRGDAEDLALAAYSVEPDAGDAAGLLLDILRQDAILLDPAAATKQLEAALAANSKDWHVRRVLGVCYLELGEFGKSRLLLDEIVAERPTDLDGWEALVRCVAESKDQDQLKTILAKLPAGAQADPRFLRAKADVALGSDQPGEAVTILRRAIEADPADRKAHFKLATALRLAGDPTGAAEHQKRSEELEKARNDLAELYQRAEIQGRRLTKEQCLDIARLAETGGRGRLADAWRKEAERPARLTPKTVAGPAPTTPAPAPAPGKPGGTAAPAPTPPTKPQAP